MVGKRLVYIGGLTNTATGNTGAEAEAGPGRAEGMNEGVELDCIQPSASGCGSLGLGSRGIGGRLRFG